LRGNLKEKDLVVSELLKNDKDKPAANPMRGMRF
jgi:hypothetical protein